MPLWLERFFIEHPWAVWWPLFVCVGGAGVLWWWQSRRKAKGGSARMPVRVGWFGALATTFLVLGGIAMAGHMIGLWPDVWAFVNERPTLVAWWMVGAGGAVVLWGVAVHAWRGEARLSRQCRRCGYDMGGLAGVMTCPECGRVAKNERQLRPRNTRRSALWLGGLIMLVAAVLPTGFAVRQRGAAAALPTRVLLWWVSRIGSPPDSVMRETRWRMGHTEGTWERVAASHADGLAARMLECPAANIDDYAAMIEALSVSEQRQKDAVASALSPDPVRRLAAMKLLAAAREPIEIDEKLIAGWERDADRRVATAAGVVRYSQLSHAIALLSGATAVPLSEQGALRCLRICTSTPAIWVWDLPGLQKYEAHARREIALRATCLVGARELLQTEPNPERLAAMFMAKSELDHSPFGPGPTWASAGSVCVSGRPQLGVALSACVSHRDPRVREVFFRQLSPSAAIPRGASWGAVIVLWQGLLPELERQLGVEDDAAAKVALARLMNEIKGSPPAGQTP